MTIVDINKSMTRWIKYRHHRAG